MEKEIKIIPIIILLLGVSALVFLFAFRVREVEVIGNTRYTEAEIKDMALAGIASSNTVMATWLKGNQEVVDIPFLDGFKVERVNNNKLRIIVSEKQIIGYINYQGSDMFFDKDGLVVESVEPKIVDGKQVIVGETVEEVETIAPQAIEAGEVEDITSFQAAVTNVPLIEGLNATEVALNQRLKVDNPEVFTMIWGIARMVEKFNIQPDKVVFDENSQATMYYGNVRVLLGSDTLLEEKISRAAAILPELVGKSGELHLEDYTEGVGSIVFSGDVAEKVTGVPIDEEGSEE